MNQKPNELTPQPTLPLTQIVCPCGTTFQASAARRNWLPKNCPECRKHLAARRVTSCRLKKRITPYDGHVLFGGRGGSPLAIRTMKETADILGISPAAVARAESSAFAKLRAHPLIQRIWKEEYGNN